MTHPRNCPHCVKRNIRWRMVLPTLAVLAWCVCAFLIGMVVRMVVASWAQ